jgi:hypothetical protein
MRSPRIRSSDGLIPYFRRRANSTRASDRLQGTKGPSSEVPRHQLLGTRPHPAANTVVLRNQTPRAASRDVSAQPAEPSVGCQLVGVDKAPIAAGKDGLRSQDQWIWLDHAAFQGRLIAVDPAIGSADAIGCKVVAQHTKVQFETPRARGSADCDRYSSSAC